MLAAVSLDLLYHALGWTLASACIVFCLLALFRDRARGRRRCPRCWYDMAATPGLTCPECGHQARSEEGLFKTRRRKRLAALSLLLLPCAYLVHSWPLVKAGGWMAPIPTRLLLEMYPWTGPGTKLGDEVLDRAGLGPRAFRPGRPLVAPSDDLLTAYITRAARGNWLARPTSPRWQRTYGDLLSQLSHRVSSDELDRVTVYPGPRDAPSLSAAIREWGRVPVVVNVRTRSKWPRGMPITVWAHPKTWWPIWLNDEEALTWSANGSSIQKSEFRFDGTLNPGLEGRIVIEGTVKILQQDWRASPVQPRHEFSSAPFRFEYETVDSIDECMQAVGSAQFDQFLASSLTAVYDNTMIRFSMTSLVPPGYDDAAFGAKLEVLAGDKVLMTAHIRGTDLAKVFSGQFTYGNVDFTDNDPDAARLRGGEVDPAWRVRIQTDPQWALSELDADKYWKGEFTIPITTGKGVPPRRSTRPPPPK